jgi:hypothetical protein
MFTGIIFSLSAMVFYITIFNLDPLGSQRWTAFVSFFVSFFCGIGAFFTLVFFFGAELFSGRKLSSGAFLVAVRRGVLMSLFVTLIATLQLWRLLGLFEVVLLAIFLSLVEWIFVTLRRV